MVPVLSRVRSSGRGLGKLAEGVNATEKVHPPEVPEPGAERAVHLLPKNWVGNNSIFEDVIEARGRGEKWDCWGGLGRHICVL